MMVCECKFCHDMTEIGADRELDMDFLVKYGRKHFCGHGMNKFGVMNIVTTGEKVRVIFAGHK